jgi:hypothetical protein
MTTTASGVSVRDDVEILPVIQAAALDDEAPEERWIVDGFWPVAAVGVIGGHPKSCKTWWGLELAVSVASGTPCLGRFKVKRPARVLIYLAEDPAHSVRERIDAIARQRGISLRGLDLHVITMDRLRLDTNDHKLRLDVTLARLKPSMLLLDPLVRMHDRDENHSHEITPILSALRVLQRRHNVAIALVHHARKNAHGHHHGQSLRGSGDIFAWADVLHYLKRETKGIRLTVEHRSAPTPDPVMLDLVGEPPCLDLIADNSTSEPTLQDRILQTLARADTPLRRTELRGLLAVNNKRLGDAIAALESLGRIRRTPDGWHS